MEIVRDVGLITCERGVFGQGARLLSWRCPDDGHMDEEVQLKVQVEEEKIGETHVKEHSEEQRVKVQTTAQRG